jgi:(p)ppGpp synthase/HD superfamily hydrolase
MEHEHEFDCLAGIVLAPWIAKATALRWCRRKVGGNQFRHAMATLAILIDYHYIQPLLLKTAVIHDLIEDCPDIHISELESIDEDSPRIISLLHEVTRQQGEDKILFLNRIRYEGSPEARIIKCSDRISNLTDLHSFIFDNSYITFYLDQTEEYVYPMALETDTNMAFEISDLIHRRRQMLSKK